jgi:hypothetical protein
MCFTSWDEFREEFTAAFCPENEVTTALMRLESDQYFQGKRNIEVYIDKFKDLVDLHGPHRYRTQIPPWTELNDSG